MAKPLRNQAAQDEFAAALRDLAKRKPDMRVREIEKYGWREGIDIAAQSIRNALNGDVDPTGCSLELLFVLAGYFDVQPDGLGSHAAARINAAHEHLKTRFGWSRATAA